MDCGRDYLPARPTRDAWYPISVRQVAVLLGTAFRRHLAMTPLRFANPSPPSGGIGDFHPQAIEHAGHTTKPLQAVSGSDVDWAACRLRRLWLSTPNPTSVCW